MEYNIWVFLCYRMYAFIKTEKKCDNIYSIAVQSVYILHFNSLWKIAKHTADLVIFTNKNKLPIRDRYNI